MKEVTAKWVTAKGDSRHGDARVVAINPGDWWGKCHLLGIGGSYSPSFFVVEADSVQDAIDELIESKYGAELIVTPPDLADYRYDELHYSPSGQPCDLSELMILGSHESGGDGGRVTYFSEDFPEGVPAEEWTAAMEEIS